jgi:hypothetical protein
MSIVNHQDFSKAALNPVFSEIRNGIRYFAAQRLATLPVARVEITEIVPFGRPDRNNRIGHIIFKVPAGLMQVKNWTGQEIEWLGMDQYDYNGFNSSRTRLMFGSGYIKLSIREGYDKAPYISWPREKGKDGTWWDVFKTADVRFGIYHSDNNYNVAAALTTFLLTYWGEFVKADPRNRFGFNEHCGNCRHMVYLPIHDGMGHDYENKANPIDTSELTQYGSRMPQWICGVHKDLTDEDAIDDLNEYGSFEVRSYTDRETGQLRWLRPDQTLIKGVPVSTYKVRADGTSERCAECPFYAKNEKKPDRSYNREKEASGGGYVPKYWTERAQANRQPVFTKHAGGWSLGFPGEFTNATEICVQGIGGLEVYGAPARDVVDPTTGETHHIPAVCASMKKDFVPTTEAYKQDDAQVAKLVNIIYHTCFNFDTLSADSLTALLGMVQATPIDSVNDPLKSRYERALARLAQTVADHE